VAEKDLTSVERYRNWYIRLLRLYPKSYRERFGEGMSQTFHDLLRERASGDRRLFGSALWMFAETFTEILKQNGTSFVMRYRNILRIALATALILLGVFAAMQTGGDIAWSGTDFVFAGVLLFGMGVAAEIVLRKGNSFPYRAALGLSLGSALLLTWINLAAGIIGPEDNPANRMYLGVVAIEAVGALAARLRPHGMAWALFAATLAQTIVTIVALLTQLNSPWDAQLKTLVLNVFFALVFVGAARLFQLAGSAGPRTTPAA